jgi:GDSL-like Lipase/Acylhydrolase family
MNFKNPNWLAAVILFAGIFPTAQSLLKAETRHFSPEEIEWTWEVRPADYNPNLPNVLLLGDSITRNYYPVVKKQLAGKANVYLMASSTCVGDPRLPEQIAQFSQMEEVRFSIVHFNNGMHGWAYSEAEYRRAFPAFLRAIRAAAPGAQLIWATTTPVKVDASPGPTNARVDARNAIAKTFIDAAHVTIDDQHALMMHHLDTYQDTVHFNTVGSTIQASQAVKTIEPILAVLRQRHQ